MQILVATLRGAEHQQQRAAAYAALLIAISIEYPYSILGYIGRQQSCSYQVRQLNMSAVSYDSMQSTWYTSIWAIGLGLVQYRSCMNHQVDWYIVFDCQSTVQKWEKLIENTHKADKSSIIRMTDLVLCVPTGTVCFYSARFQS